MLAPRVSLLLPLWLVTLGWLSAAENTIQLPSNDDGLAGAGPIRRDYEFPRHWRERRSSWIAQTSRDRQAVVFVGDAIIERWGAGLVAAFKGVKVANRGIAGDTTRGVLLRLGQDVLSLDPKVIVLLIGGDDLELGAAPETAAGNLRLILAAIEQKDPRLPIIVCQALPPSDAAAKASDRVKSLNAAYLDVVRNRPNVTYVETWLQFADANGNATTRDFVDGHQLNEAGYDKLAAGLRPFLSTLGVLTESEPFTPEPGFVSLFNEHDLTGWGFRATPADAIAASKKKDASNPRPPVRVYFDKPIRFAGQTVTPEGRFLARNGRLVVTTPPEYRKIQQLYTEREFPQDFILRLDFRAGPNADSGVFIRGPQLQVRDYLVAGPYNQLKNYRPQDWNQLEITVTGGEAVCTCNGEVLEAHFKVPATGPIGVEGDRGQMEYRRLRIKVLP